MLIRAVFALALLLMAGCDNNPWPRGAADSNTLFTAVIENSPRHLDPTASYWNNETPFMYQIYETVYGYHYLKRPYQLVPKLAVDVVQPRYIGREGQTLPPDAPADQVAESIYDIRIKPGVRFQPHPAFAVDEQGRHRYHGPHAQPAATLGDKRTPAEFEHQGTRELVAEDFVYAYKRHATTRITTPIFSTFAEVIKGLRDYAAVIRSADAKLRQGLDPASLDKPFLDFRQYPLEGATAPEKHLLRLRIKGKNPQWNYWMQLTFTAPVPWEADAFYATPGFAERGLTLDGWPVGTGPYMLVENVKDRRLAMARNPNYRGEPYPCEGEPGDEAAGLLADCGKPTPFVDRIEFAVEREEVSRRGKFRQGYYDIEVMERIDTGLDYLVAMQDSEEVRREYLDKGFRLNRGSDVNSYFIAFNMLDPTVGQGKTPQDAERSRKLRQAISIAIDWEEYSKIFPKRAGQTAMSPVPPGIFGSREGTREGLNPVTHTWVPDASVPEGGRAVRRPIADARKLLEEAGYGGGRDARSGKPLVLNYDVYYPPTPERKPEIDWVVRQFAKLGIQLEVRATDNNQFQEKTRKGQYQVFWLGWNADYPDAENFLFLLNSKASKTLYDGENTANYNNPEYDRLFLQMKVLEDGPAKQALIDQMVAIAQQDAPWTMGFFPYASAAAQGWVHNLKSAVIVRDFGRYLRLDMPRRTAAQASWNTPVWWPMLGAAAAAVLLWWLGRRVLQRRERLDGRGLVKP